MKVVKGMGYTECLRGKERAWGALKCVLNNNRGLRKSAKMCQSEGVILPTALYGTES